MRPVSSLISSRLAARNAWGVVGLDKDLELRGLGDGAFFVLLLGLDSAATGEAQGGVREIALAGLDDPPLRLLLGGDVLAAIRQKLAEMAASIDEWEAVTLDVGF